MTDNNLVFSVDSQLLGELGERLVTRNYIALAELIKNAYDADAKNLKLKFVNAKKGRNVPKNGEIHIIDDGHGMTFEEINKYWMIIATPYKRREPFSPKYGRRKTGNKGVGRFACRRLAKRLILESVAKIPNSNEYEFTTVYFNWEDFQPGKQLNEIPCNYTTKRLSEGKTGLSLKLTELTELWSEYDFILLRRQILTLTIPSAIRRKGYDEDPGFEVRLEASEFPEGVGVLVDQFIDAGWGTLDGTIKIDGSVYLELIAKKIGCQNFDIPIRYPDLAGISFKIAWIPTMRKEYYRNPDLLTKSNVREIMLEQGGIRVYMDGFRVYPYGDPGNDWLDIDKDVARRRGEPDKILKSISTKFGVDFSRSMLNHPRHNNLIGIVSISSEKTPSLEMKLDREGFIENSSYHRLRRLIRISLDWMVINYNKFLSINAEESAKEAENNFKLMIGHSQKNRSSSPQSNLETKSKEVSSELPQKGTFSSPQGNVETKSKEVTAESPQKSTSLSPQGNIETKSKEVSTEIPHKGASSSPQGNVETKSKEVTEIPHKGASSSLQGNVKTKSKEVATEFPQKSTSSIPQDKNEFGTDVTAQKSTTLDTIEVSVPSKDLLPIALSTLSQEARRGILHLPEKEKKESEEVIDSALNLIQQTLNKEETYISNLGTVASSAVIFFAYTHEIKTFISLFETLANNMTRIIQKIPPEDKNQFEKMSKDIKATRDRFDKQIQLFFNLADKTSDIGLKRIPIKKTAKEVIECFRFLIEYYCMDEPILDIPESLISRPIREAELFSIILNLVSNAIKANLANNGSKICIEGQAEGKKVILRVYDEGVGISKEYQKLVFQQFNPDPEKKLYRGLKERIKDEELLALGRGSGLGLSIVKQFVEKYNGDVYFIDAKKPWVTCIEVILL